MSITARLLETRTVIRVLACVAAPFDPEEVHELASVDVVVDGEGARIEALHAQTFALADRDDGLGATACTPMHVATTIWGRRSPDVLAAHDASTAALTFKRALTGGLRWMSLHKMARRVWPGQHSYELTPLSRWRSWTGPRGLFSYPLPSGAERDAELAAGLLVELLRDPGLRDVAEGVWLAEADREASAGASAAFRARDAVDAALVASAMPSKPLREAPFPFDDQREWGGIGSEDLKYFARFSEDSLTAEAARAELRTRLECC